jgi:hypothetical protein
MSELDKDGIVSRLDENPATSEARAKIAYRILKSARSNDQVINEALRQYCNDFSDSIRLDDLMDVIHRSRLRLKGGIEFGLLGLAWGILPNNDELDGYLAEYYFIWGSENGVAEDKIVEIFNRELGR